MGIRVFGRVKFDGVDLADFGVTLSGTGTFNAPERDVTYMSGPGKNGDLIFDNGRYKNIQVTYPINIELGLPDKVKALRAFLLSHKGYFRLEDSYHPDEFRLAQYAGPFEINPTGSHNRYGRMQLVFDCKPQRFLKAGELPLPQISSTSSALNLTIAQGYASDIFSSQFKNAIGISLWDDRIMTVVDVSNYYGYKIVLHYSDERVNMDESIISGESTHDPTTSSATGGSYGDTVELYDNTVELGISDNYVMFETPVFYELYDSNDDFVGSLYPTSVTVKNPTAFPAKPLIRVHYTSDLVEAPLFMINEASVTAELYESININNDSVTINDAYIDCDTLDFYSPMTGYKRPKNWNNQSFISSEITLQPGDNIIKLNDNADYIEIIPRWWVL